MARPVEKTVARSRWPRVLVMCVVLLAVGGGVGWYYAYGRENPDVTRARELMAQLAPDSKDPLPDDKRRDAFRELRTVAERLPEDQRSQLFRDGPMGRMRQRMQKEISGYFEQPAEQRVAYLDQRIDDMESRMARWRERASSGDQGERRARVEGGRGGGGPGDGGPPSGGATGGGPGPGGPGGGPGGDGRRGGPRGGGTDEQRRERMRGFLEDTTPEERAQASEFMRAMRERRKQRGLPDFGGGRPF